MTRHPARIRRPLSFAFLALAFACAIADTALAGPTELTLAQKIAWQIALDRVCFSPGIIDGKPGRKTRLATREFQIARGMPGRGRIDETTAKALGADPQRSVTYHTITREDQAQVGAIPKGWLAKSRAKRLPYPSLLQMVAEKYHCSRSLLAILNPKQNLNRLAVGDRIIVPHIEPARETTPAATRLKIDTDAKVIRAYAGEKLVGMFHCSVAARRAKIPTRPTRVIGVTMDPTYRFDPDMWPEVRGIHRVLIIPPGPRNPVGLCWIGLGLRGYGIHGTPAPEMIGKTGSHGCFRLTNWDAVRLGKMVKKGTPVRFLRGG